MVAHFTEGVAVPLRVVNAVFRVNRHAVDGIHFLIGDVYDWHKEPLQWPAGSPSPSPLTRPSLAGGGGYGNRIRYRSSLASGGKRQAVEDRITVGLLLCFWPSFKARDLFQNRIKAVMRLPKPVIRPKPTLLQAPPDEVPCYLNGGDLIFGEADGRWHARIIAAKAGIDQ